jgi:uncharacterized linocin/CFP29 family protein
MPNDPQVPWTDEQWARVNQVIQEEAGRARVAATFLPLYGPLPPDTDFVRADRISYAETQDVLRGALVEIRTARTQFDGAVGKADIDTADIDTALAAERRSANARSVLGPQHIRIDDKDTIKLATLEVKVPVRGAQMADPEMTSVLALFRRAANVLARLEDAVVFRGLTANPAPPHVRPRAGVAGLPPIWEISGGQELDGLWTTSIEGQFHEILVEPSGYPSRGQRLVGGISKAVGDLEGNGHFGPFTVVLGQELFVIAQNPDPGSLVLPQDRIIPFLGGGSLLRSTTLPTNSGVVVALGGAPVELVVAKDVSVAFLQVTDEPKFLFRVYEKIVLRVKEREAIMTIHMQPRGMA